MCAQNRQVKYILTAKVMMQKKHAFQLPTILIMYDKFKASIAMFSHRESKISE